MLDEVGTDDGSSQDAEDRLVRMGVDAREGLIKHKHVGITDERASGEDTLLLTA